MGRLPDIVNRDSEIADSIERTVRFYYDQTGWQRGAGVYGDARLWEDSRPVAARYQSTCRMRVSHRLTLGGRLLDAGCGAVQFPEWTAAHARFREVVLFDLSLTGLSETPARGRKTAGSLRNLPFKPGSFDAVMCINVVNHVPRNQQEDAIVELLGALREGGALVVVSYNPDAIRLRTRRKAGGTGESGTRRELYWSAPSLGWWTRFRGLADIEYKPYRSLFVTDLQVLVPESWSGRLILWTVSAVERLLPSLAVCYGAYYMVVLTRKGGAGC